MDIELELERLVKHKKIGNCKKCGGQMVPDLVGRYTCRGCGETVLDEVGQVRDYLEKNGKTSYAVVEQDTNASAEVLHRFLR
jgi:transposase-like protein